MMDFLRVVGFKLPKHFCVSSWDSDVPLIVKLCGKNDYFCLYDNNQKEPKITARVLSVKSHVILDEKGNPFTSSNGVNLEEFTEYLHENRKDKVLLLDEIKGNFYKYPFLITNLKTESKGGTTLSVMITLKQDYTMNFREALYLISRGAFVKRKASTSDIRQIDGEKFLWYNTGDGYLPWFPSEEAWNATDWGVKLGFL